MDPSCIFLFFLGIIFIVEISSLLKISSEIFVLNFWILSIISSNSRNFENLKCQQLFSNKLSELSSLKFVSLTPI